MYFKITQYLFISVNKYFTFFSCTTEIYSWKSKGIKEKSIENTGASPLPIEKFSGHCLINKLSYSSKVINLHISFTLNPWSRDLNTDLTYGYCLFGLVKLTKNAGPDKYT